MSNPTESIEVEPSDPSEKRIVQHRLVRPLLSAVTIAALAWCAWAGVNGNEGAGRVLQFAAWFMAITFIGAVCPADFGDVRAKGRSLPAWLSHGTGIAMILFLVWHGWIWTAIALALHEIGVASVFRTNSEITQRPKGD